ncbi:MAG: DoxX family protein [Blastocatellia bacterium]|nr:DoxX family protein [Blastocatellia bacterium]
MAGRLIATTPTWAPLPIRLALGAIMFAHGAQKIFGAWGGKGFSAWLASPAPFNLQPSWTWMAAAAFSEFLGGALVMIGLFTRVGAFFIACVMSVAIFGVHWQRGFFINSGGFEFPLALFAMAVTLLVTGGGNASIDSQMQ